MEKLIKLLALMDSKQFQNTYVLKVFMVMNIVYSGKILIIKK